MMRGRRAEGESETQRDGWRKWREVRGLRTGYVSRFLCVSAECMRACMRVCAEGMHAELTSSALLRYSANSGPEALSHLGSVQLLALELLPHLPEVTLARQIEVEGWADSRLPSRVYSSRARAPTGLCGRHGGSSLW